jgi:thiol-disulfide isomerase/thioredoxin
MRLQSADGGIEPLVDPEADRTLVYLWAPWCGVCTAQSGTVEWARSALGDGVAVRSVVFDWESARQARRSARDKGLEAPVLLADRSVADALNVGAFPTFYVLSREGRVVGHSRGYTTTLGLLWRAWW